MKTKKADRIVLIVLLLSLIPFFIPEKAPVLTEGPTELRLISLGIPYTEFEARYPWDMRCYDGYLYLGAGDYNKNQAPNALRRLSLKTYRWETLNGFKDEHAERFLVLDGKLTIPGVDACEDWSLGNYYTIEKGALQAHRVLPNGIHNFDLAFLEGKTFAALGTESPHSPLVVSEDAKTFVSVDFVTEEGKDLLSEDFYTARIYDLFTLAGDLYAILSLCPTEQTLLRSIYRYEEDGKMHYFGKYPSLDSVSLHYFPIIADVEKEDFLLFSTGRLYRTDDMQAFTDITPADTRYIVDLAEADGEIYALGSCIP